MPFADVIPIPRRNVHHHIALHYRLTSQAGIQLVIGSLFHAVELVVIHLGKIIDALFHDDMAGGAGATASASVFEMKAEIHSDVEQRLGLAVILVRQLAGFKLNAAILAGYVAEAHDPFNTTENFDGHLTLQNGINDRFGTVLIDRFSSFFPLRPNDASFIADPTDHAFEACLSAHATLETILLADRNARLSAKAYNDEYFDHFYNLTAATLIRQLSEASTDVGSYWLTAWTNAGKPAVPQTQPH